MATKPSRAEGCLWRPFSAGGRSDCGAVEPAEAEAASASDRCRVVSSALWQVIVTATKWFLLNGNIVQRFNWITLICVENSFHSYANYLLSFPRYTSIQHSLQRNLFFIWICSIFIKWLELRMQQLFHGYHFISELNKHNRGRIVWLRSANATGQLKTTRKPLLSHLHTPLQARRLLRRRLLFLTCIIS